ncbi:hypothetical protein MUK42_25812 [Musa troglodytarum]|uniref:Uncharacterized protein n=2 Tax=Musa troglodytarum TaxID=320322 RepID=A0A9E7H1I2_9LILI|nr:hypothetical protein MUK42_25812 [Musa troglodytarum]
MARACSYPLVTTTCPSPPMALSLPSSASRSTRSPSSSTPPPTSSYDPFPFYFLCFDIHMNQISHLS